MGVNVSNNIYSEVNIRFTPQNACTCILPGTEVSTKVVKKIVKFQRAKLTKMWASGGSFLVYMRYVWLLRFQSQSEVIWYISDFRQPCISTYAGRRAKRIKIWASCAST